MNILLHTQASDIQNVFSVQIANGCRSLSLSLSWKEIHR